MTKEEFIQNLSRVDWYYNYIEGIEKYRKEQDFYFKVHKAAKLNPEFQKLFDEEEQRHFPSQQIVS